MRSFRLDPESVREFSQTWKWLVLIAVVVGAVLYFDVSGRTLKVVYVVSVGLMVVEGLRKPIGSRIRERYPNARALWLMGFTSCFFLFGLMIRMIFDELQGTLADVIWIWGSFITLGVFVFLNRKNREVMR